MDSEAKEIGILERLDRLAESFEKVADKMSSPVIKNPPGGSGPANAGNIHITPGESGKVSTAGKLAISLQGLANKATDYGLKAPFLSGAASWAKMASAASGDIHIRGEEMRSKGIRNDAGGDIESILRAIEANTARGRNESAGMGDQFGGDDLRDCIGDLKDTIKELAKAILSTGERETGIQQMPPNANAQPAKAQAKPQSGRDDQQPIRRPPAQSGMAVLTRLFSGS